MKRILFVSQTESKQNLVAPIVEALVVQGYTCIGKVVSQLKNADYDHYDYLIGVEPVDLRDIYHICGGDFSEKIFLLEEFIDRQGATAK